MDTRIISDLVKSGDKVSYGRDRLYNTGVVLGKIPSINNMSPQFVVRDDKGYLENIDVSDVIDIL